MNYKTITAIVDAYRVGGYRQARALVKQCGGKWKKGMVKILKEVILYNLPPDMGQKKKLQLTKEARVSTTVRKVYIGSGDGSDFGPQRWDSHGVKLELNSDDEFIAGVYAEDYEDGDAAEGVFYENPLELVQMKEDDKIRYNGKRRVKNPEARKMILEAYNRIKILSEKKWTRINSGQPAGKISVWIREALHKYEFLLNLYTFEYRGLADRDLDVYDTYAGLLEPVIEDHKEHEKCSFTEEIGDDEEVNDNSEEKTEYSKGLTEISYEMSRFNLIAHWGIGHSDKVLRKEIRLVCKEMTYSELRYWAEFLRTRLYVRKPKWDAEKRSYVTNPDGSMPITFYKSSETPAFRNVKRIWSNLEKWLKVYDRPLITKINWTVEFTELQVKSEPSTKYPGRRFWTIKFKADGVPHTIRKADGCSNWLCSPHMQSTLLTESLAWVKKTYKK